MPVKAAFRAAECTAEVYTKYSPHIAPDSTAPWSTYSITIEAADSTAEREAIRST